jgi:hypothetical protein
VSKAIDYLRSRIRAGSSLAEAASVAALSSSRFRHLFVQETGTSFRAYILWLRLNVAIQTAMQGRSWTDAAHEAVSRIPRTSHGPSRGCSASAPPPWSFTDGTNIEVTAGTRFACRDQIRQALS